MNHYICSSLLLAVLTAPPKESQTTLTELVDGLRKTEASIHNLSVTTEYVKLQTLLLPVDKPVRMNLVTKFIVDSDGRSWYDCVGEQVNTGRKPEDVRVYRGRWMAAFDGKVAKSMIGDADGVFHWGGIDRYPSWHGINPLEFTTHYFQQPVSKLLQKAGSTVVGQVLWDKRQVMVVDRASAGKKQKRKYRFWIDPERKTVVRRAALIQFAPDQKWQEYTRIESREHKEIRPGMWLPMRVKYESLHVTKDIAPEQLNWSYEGRNKDWKVNEDLPADRFQLVFPDNVVVTDRRKPQAKSKE